MSLTLPPNPARAKIAEARPFFGSFVFSLDPAVTEMLGGAGFDLAVIDMEHAANGFADLLAHGRAAHAAGVSWWVRVGVFEPSTVGRILDAGAQGIIFPHYGVDRDESRRAAESVRYAPMGTRPTCTGIRGAAYGLSPFTDYVKHSNHDVMAIGLIEDAIAVDRIEEIVENCMLDAIIPGGVGDLATSLGVHGQGRHPRVLEAVRKVVRTCKAKKGLKVGVYVSDLAAFDELKELEADFYIYSIDYKVTAAAYGDLHTALVARL